MRDMRAGARAGLLRLQPVGRNVRAGASNSVQAVSATVGPTASKAFFYVRFQPARSPLFGGREGSAYVQGFGLKALPPFL